MGNIAYYDVQDVQKQHKLFGHITHCLRPCNQPQNDYSQDIVVS